MDNNSYPRPTPPQPANKLESILPLILKKWYWLLLAGLVGLALAFFYNKYFPGSYKSSMTVLLKNEPHQSPLNSTLDNLEIKEKPINIQDEQMVLSSYSLQLKTLRNLNWKTSWYRKLLIGSRDLYGNEPFKVTVTDEKDQLKGVPLTIHAVSDSAYTVECDWKDKTDDSLRTIRFKQQVSFGKPFWNEYFHFTLDLLDPAALKELNGYSFTFNDPAQMAMDYQGQLDVKIPAPESNALSVELKGRNIQRNVDYLNALGAAYLKFGLDQKNQSAVFTMRFIKNQIAGVADSLQTSGNRITNFRSSNKAVDLGQEGSIILQRVEDVDKQENALKLKMNYYNDLNTKVNSEEAMKNFAPAGIGDPDLNTLVTKLSSQYSQRETLSISAQPKNPRLIALNKDIEMTQQIIKNNISTLVANTQKELESLEDQKRQVNAKLTDIPRTERTLLDIKRGFDVNSQLYNFLLQKQAEAGIALASNSPSAMVLDAAQTQTTEPTGLKPMFNLAIGLLLGLLVAFGLILLKEYTNRRLRNTEEVTNNLHLSVAALIPHNRLKSDLPVAHFPRSEITESFRNLRATLYYLLKDGKNHVVAIHSAIQGEGKSFIAANLAAILAQGNKKVLLVEADRKNSQLSEIFEAGDGKGLGNYLNGKASLSEILSPTEVKGLTLIRAGSAEDLFAAFTETAHIARFIADARSSYDYILIDNSPMDILSDARSIAAYADINLFVLRMGYSTQQELSYVNKTADQEVIKNMIVALNDTEPGRRDRKAGYFNEKSRTLS